MSCLGGTAHTRWFPELTLAALHPVPLHVGQWSSGLVSKSHAWQGDVADDCLSCDSSEMSPLVCWQWSEPRGPALGWAVQLAVCACALHAFRECSPPLPLNLAGFASSGTLGLELHLFTLLGWFLLGMPRNKEWSQGGLAQCTTGTFGITSLPTITVLLGCCLAPLVSLTSLGVDKEMMFLRWSLCSPVVPLFWLLREKTQPMLHALF